METDTPKLNEQFKIGVELNFSQSKTFPVEKHTEQIKVKSTNDKKKNNNQKQKTKNQKKKTLRKHSN